MADARAITIELDAQEVELLTEALDSHEYWQLSDPTWRRSGYVILPDDDQVLWSDRPPVDDEEHRAMQEIVAARRLADRLRQAQ